MSRESPNPRWRQITVVVSTLVASWYGMMLVHELGHVLAAWATGSRIDRVRVPFFGLSQTEISVPKHALLVVAAGPIAGIALPLIAWLVACASSGRGSPSGTPTLLRFFAGFCLVANGGYLASGLASPVGDVEELILLGIPAWSIAGAGLVAAACGLWMWNGLGPSFGFRSASIATGVLRSAIIAAAGVVGIVLVLAFLG